MDSVKPRYIIALIVVGWFGLFVGYAALTHPSPHKAAAVVTTTPGTLTGQNGSQLSENGAAPPTAPLLAVPTGPPTPLHLDPGLRDPAPSQAPATADSPKLQEASDLQKLASEGWTALGGLPFQGKRVTIYYGGTTGPRFVLNVVIHRGTIAQARNEAVAYIRKGGEDPQSYVLQFTSKSEQQTLSLNQLQGKLAENNVFISLLPYSSGHITVRFLGVAAGKAEIGIFYGGSRHQATKEFAALLRSYKQKAILYQIIYKHN